MSTETPHHKNAAAQTPADFLRALFLERKARNPAYSTRAFARDLGISQPLLSMVMNGKRPLTLQQAMQIGVLLGFSQDRTQAFLNSTLLALPKGSKGSKAQSHLRDAQSATEMFVDYEVERFKTLSHWYHLPIADLTATHDFRDDPAWIARRLGISSLEARDALSRLETLGMVERPPAGGLRKTNAKFYFTTQRSELGVRQFHKQMIGKALDQLDLTGAQDFAAREISSMTMAISRKRVVEAQAKIQTFQKELCDFLSEPTTEHPVFDDVYQLNVQLFPLTKATPQTQKSETP